MDVRRPILITEEVLENVCDKESTGDEAVYSLGHITGVRGQEGLCMLA